MKRDPSPRLWLWLAFALCLPGARSIAGHAVDLQRWLYCSQNLWVDQNIDELETLFARAAKAGYTHVLIADSKFSKLGDMDGRYFRNVDHVKRLAATNGLEIVPALFAIGYSNDLLWHNPNLVEALPVESALFVVQRGVASLVPDPAPELKGAGFADLSQWDWKDETVDNDHETAHVKDPNGRNARIVQKLKVTPFRQYHLSVGVRTRDFEGTPEVKVLAGDRALNFNPLGVKPTQNWTRHHVVFNSLDNAEVTVYLGCWDGRRGELWWDNVRLEEVGLLNVVRRPGTPLVVTRETGEVLEEGRDYSPVSDRQMGNTPWNGEYDVHHRPPVIRTQLPDGTRLRVSYYHAATVHDGQAMICPSEPETIELLRDQARRMHLAWGARGYLMSHDEIRVFNWCDACRRRGLDAGALLADNVRTCIRILREVNPGGRIYVWSDMFDPNHNAHGDYYLVRGNLAGSWEGLDPDVIIMNWNFGKRAESLKFFAGRGNRQVIAGFYDHDPRQVLDWLDAAEGVSGVTGVLYTTWRRDFSQLETFARLLDPK